MVVAEEEEPEDVQCDGLVLGPLLCFGACVHYKDDAAVIATMHVLVVWYISSMMRT